MWNFPSWWAATFRIKLSVFWDCFGENFIVKVKTSAKKGLKKCEISFPDGLKRFGATFEYSPGFSDENSL